MAESSERAALQERIAAALAGHTVNMNVTIGGRVHCSCGDVVDSGSIASWFTTHQARVVLDALGLELVGWCDDPDWTDLTKNVGRLWHKSKPRMDAVPVYRLAALTGSEEPS